MGAAIRLDDPKALGRFVPLGELEGDRLQELAAKSTLRSLAPGEALPSRGTQLHYLLSGTVELNPHGGEAERIKAGSERARHPICPPGGQCRVVARSAVTILIVDTELLELLMSWNGHTGGAYEVDEIETEEGGDWMSALLQNPALHRLPPQALRRLMAAIEPLEIGTGRDIVTQGDPSDAYYIVARGRCRVSRIPEPGAKPVTLAELGPGAAFGEEALLTDSRRNASVTATEPCLVLRLGRDAFAELLQHHLVPTVSAAEAAELEREGARRIDLRQSPDEKSGAIRIHLAELRLKAATLDKKRRYIACCEDGRQSAVAAFILNQQGFDVAVLEGGLGKPATPPRQEQASAPALEEHLKRERNARRQTDARLKRERERQKALALRIQELETQLEQQQSLEAEQRELTEQLETLQHQLDERRESEEKLAAERDAFARRIEELEARLNEQQRLETEQGELTKQIETLQRQLDERRETEGKLAAERDTLARRIETLEEELERFRAAGQEQQRLTEELAALQRAREEDEEAIESLRAELKEANLKASEAAITLEQLNETRQRLELDLERQQSAREALEQELESLRSQGDGLAETAERAAALEREIECLTRELASRHDTIVMLEQENHRLQRRADEQTALAEALEEARALLETRDRELEQAKTRQARLEERLRCVESEWEEARQAQEEEHRKWQQERGALRAELDRAREEIDLLEQRLARSREQEQQQQILEQRLERAERGHQDAERQRQALEQEVDTLREALTEAKRVSAMADQALIALKRQLKEKEQGKKKAPPVTATETKPRETGPLDDDALIRMAREALQETAGLTEADRAAPAPFCLTEEAPPKRHSGWIGKALAATAVLGALYLGAAYDPKATDFGSANAAPSAATEPHPTPKAIDPALRQSREAQLREEAKRRLEQALGQAN